MPNGEEKVLKPGEAPAPEEEAPKEETTADIIGDIAAQASQDIATSEPSALEEKSEEIIEGLETAQEARERGLEAGFERGREEIERLGAERTTAAREASRGLGAATTFSLINRIEEATQRSVRDLEARKNEALATGQVEIASRIANIQIAAIEASENQKQQAFTNLINAAQIQIQQRTEARLEQAQTQQERKDIAGIALQFGLEVREGETIDSIVARAAPLASEEQKLNMQRQRAEINRVNAETQKALAGQAFGDDPAVLESVSQVLSKLDVSDPNYGTLISSFADNPDAYSKVLTRVQELQSPRIWTDEELKSTSIRNKNENISFNESLADINSDPRITNKEDAERVLREVYGMPKGKVLSSAKVVGLGNLELITKALEKAGESMSDKQKAILRRAFGFFK